MNRLPWWAALGHEHEFALLAECCSRNESGQLRRDQKVALRS
jgi:hypothetical protein